MDTLIPICWTVGSTCAVLFFHSISELVVFSVGLAIFLSAERSSLKPLFSALAWTLPFVVPLVVIHAIINVRFQTTSFLFGIITLRRDGLIYALIVSLRIFIFTLSLVSWRYVDKEKFFFDAVHIKIPIQILVLVAVAASTIQAIAEKGKIVYIAQQARGIPAGPGIIAKIFSLPAIILPVVTSTIIDGARRGNQMMNRGLGTITISIPFEIPKRSFSDLIYAFAIFPLLLIVWIIS